MGKPEELSPDGQLREAIEKHTLMLLRAAQTARPVIYEGLYRFIQIIRFDIADGATIYLTGDPAPLRPEDLKIAPKIED